MKLLDSLTVYYKNEPRCIELYSGDLTELAAHPVDCLVVSAFQDDYIPMTGSLIGSLHQKGVSLTELARSKAVDLRPSYSCWWSYELTLPGSPARRILCFEPSGKRQAADLLSDVFQSLTTMILANPSVHTVAMPLLAGGYQQGKVGDLLPALMEAAVRWMEAGLSITRLLLVETSELKAAEMKGAFSVLKRQYSGEARNGCRTRHEVFISYCQKDGPAVDFILAHLQKKDSALRIFRDTHIFKPGTMWCQELFEAIEHSRRVVAMLSPQYLASAMCREEWNIAYLRQVSSGQAVLFPILLYSAELPAHMQTVHYEDCREADKTKLATAGDKMFAAIRP